MTATPERAEVRFMRLEHARGLPAPDYASAGAAGCDLAAAVADGAPIRLAPGERQAIPTGLVLGIPEGFEGQVRPRSGLALKNGVTVLNAPGTIDCDYRGEVKVILINQGREVFEISRGMRIAQLVIAKTERPAFRETEALDDTSRGSGGFGSTGTHSTRRTA